MFISLEKGISSSSLKFVFRLQRQKTKTKVIRDKELKMRRNGRGTRAYNRCFSVSRKVSSCRNRQLCWNMGNLTNRWLDGITCETNQWHATCNTCNGATKRRDNSYLSVHVSWIEGRSYSARLWNSFVVLFRYNFATFQFSQLCLARNYEITRYLRLVLQGSRL